VTRISSTDDGLRAVLFEAYKKGFSVQSDFARSKADYVAMAASLGYLSTKLFGLVFSREWRVTPEGLEELEFLMGRMGEPDEYEDDE
jgi:hypothetical protein